MAGTFSNILLHVIFSTKNRVLAIKPDLQDRLYAFIGGIVRDERGTLLHAGGTPDHLHLLIRWRTDGAVSDLLRNVKTRTRGYAPGYHRRPLRGRACLAGVLNG